MLTNFVKLKFPINHILNKLLVMRHNWPSQDKNLSSFELDNQNVKHASVIYIKHKQQNIPLMAEKYLSNDQIPGDRI